MDDLIQILIAAQIGGLLAGLDQAKAKIEQFAAPITGLFQGFTGIAEAAGIAFAVEKLDQFIERMAELGAEVEHASHMLGIGAEEVSAFNFAAEAMGIGAGGATLALERLERNMSQATQGTGLAAAAFQALGFKVSDSAGHLKSLDEMLPEIAERFAATADGPEKTAIAIALFGRAGAQMIPLLDQGRAGLERFRQMAIDTGTVISGPMAEGMENTSVGLTRLGKSFEGVGITLFEALKPAIDVVVKGLADLVQGLKNSLKAGGALNSILASMVVAIDLVVAAIETVINAFRALWEYGSAVLKNLATGFTTLGQVMVDAVTGKFSRIGDDFAQGWAKMNATAQVSFARLKEIATREVDDIKQLFANVSFAPSAFGLFGIDTSGGADAGGEGGAAKPKLPAIGDMKDKQASLMQQWRDALQQQLIDEKNFFKSAREEELHYWTDRLADVERSADKMGLSDKAYAALHLQVQTQIYNLDRENAAAWLSSYMAGLNEQLAALKDQLAEKKIGEQQWYQQSVALEQDRQNVLRQLQLEGTAQYAQSLKAIEGLEREHVQNSQKQWQSMFNVIDRNIDTMLQGVLTGTQTWQQAMVRLFDNLAVSFIADVAKMALKWAAFATLHIGSDPFAGATSLLGNLFGGGNSGNQAAQQLTHAITGQTAATVANTGGLFQQLSQGLQWIAETLGLTTASAAQTTATATSTAATTGLIPAIAALTAAVIANTAALGASAAGGIGGALGPAAMLALGLMPLAVGAWQIPRVMGALLHPGEMVLPAEVADQVRDGNAAAITGFAGGSASAGAVAGGGPAVNVTFQLQNIDSRSGVEFIMQHMPTISRQVAQAWASNPSWRPKY